MTPEEKPLPSNAQIASWSSYLHRVIGVDDENANHVLSDLADTARTLINEVERLRELEADVDEARRLWDSGVVSVVPDPRIAELEAEVRERAERIEKLERQVEVRDERIAQLDDFGGHDMTENS